MILNFAERSSNYDNSLEEKVMICPCWMEIYYVADGGGKYTSEQHYIRALLHIS